MAYSDFSLARVKKDVRIQVKKTSVAASGKINK